MGLYFLVLDFFFADFFAADFFVEDFFDEDFFVDLCDVLDFFVGISFSLVAVGSAHAINGLLIEPVRTA